MTPAAAAASFGCSAASHELSNINTTADGWIKENHAFWNCKQKEINSRSYSGSWMHPSGIWSTKFLNGSLELFRDSAEDNKNFPTRAGICDFNSPVSSRSSNGLAHDHIERGKKQDGFSGCRLFGIDLRNNSNNASLEKKAPPADIIANHANNTTAPIDICDQERLKKSFKDKKPVLSNDSLKDLQNRQSVSGSTRTRTKVQMTCSSQFSLKKPTFFCPVIFLTGETFPLFFHQVQMQGVAVGRAVDLTSLESYDDLISELEKLFEIKGELRPRNKWEVVYTDDEGDMMLVGDDPWT